jgi:hypothetical protein
MYVSCASPAAAADPCNLLDPRYIFDLFSTPVGLAGSSRLSDSGECIVQNLVGFKGGKRQMRYLLASDTGWFLVYCEEVPLTGHWPKPCP